MASMRDLGRLESVPLRTIWPNEASDFTPWLASNLDVLGQAVGLALELRQREQAVGRYALDLLLSDARRAGWSSSRTSLSRLTTGTWARY